MYCDHGYVGNWYINGLPIGSVYNGGFTPHKIKTGDTERNIALSDFAKPFDMTSIQEFKQYLKSAVDLIDLHGTPELSNAIIVEAPGSGFEPFDAEKVKLRQLLIAAEAALEHLPECDCENLPTPCAFCLLKSRLEPYLFMYSVKVCVINFAGDELTEPREFMVCALDEIFARHKAIESFQKVESMACDPALSVKIKSCTKT